MFSQMGNPPYYFNLHYNLNIKICQGLKSILLKNIYKSKAFLGFIIIFLRKITKTPFFSVNFIDLFSFLLYNVVNAKNEIVRKKISNRNYMYRRNL